MQGGSSARLATSTASLRLSIAMNLTSASDPLPVASATLAPRLRKVQCAGPHGLHHMAYTEWGDADNPEVVVCVHGLTRNSRDFDELAQALAGDYRVVCPDVVGRGRSDWLAVKTDYGFPLYMADMITLIARLDVERVHWVGTSMGGLIGMLIAGLPYSPVQRLVLNDVGPLITPLALERIAQYVGTAPVFADLDAAEAYLRQICAPFGALSDAQWRHLTRHSVRLQQAHDQASGYVMHYDPALGDLFRAAPVKAPVELWTAYDAIRCPTLALRGAESDLLAPETLQQMAQRGPRAQTVEFPAVGHAPMLMDPAQIAVVTDFLRPR